MTDWTVNPDALTRLLGLHGPDHDAGRGSPGRKASDALLAFMRPKNPAYHTTEIVNLVLSDTAAEMLSDQVGRVYFREGTTLYAVTLSDYALRRLTKQLKQALKAGPQEGA